MTEPWLELLEAACAETSQGKVATRLGYTSSYIGQVRRGLITGSLAEVERRVRAAYGGETVDCPVLGAISLGDCHDHAAAPFAASNPQRIQLWRTCQDCENNPRRQS